MPSCYTRRRIKALSERGKRMANARWKADRARRDAEEPQRIREQREIEAINLPRREGDPLGFLQWTDFGTGKVRRWVIRMGDRSDRMTMEARGKITGSHGWTWITNNLRKKLTT